MHPAGLGPGYPVDYYLYVIDDASTCNNRTIAWATMCDFLADDSRPFIGITNICPFFLTLAQDDQVSTLVHELTHALVGSMGPARAALLQLLGAPHISR